MILVTGVSSAGKTHTLEGLTSADHRFQHIRASQLLREAGCPLRPLTRQQALSNQAVLVDEIRRLKLTAAPGAILDGHATIETVEGPLPLPDEIFADLGAEAFVLIQDGPNSISERRRRRGLPWTEEEVLAFQNLERTHTARQALRLGKPYLELRSGDVEGLTQWLASIDLPSTDRADH